MVIFLDRYSCILVAFIFAADFLEKKTFTRGKQLIGKSIDVLLFILSYFDELLYCFVMTKIFV